MIRLPEIGVAEMRLRLDVREEILGRFGRSVQDSVRCYVCGRRVAIHSSSDALPCDIEKPSVRAHCAALRLQEN